MRRNLAWVGVALGSIWVAVLIISLTSPELVYGEDRNTFPLIPAVTWLSGATATSYLLRALVTRHPSADDQRRAWIGIALAAVVIWSAVTVVCLILPTFSLELGDDSVLIPLGQLIAPAAGAVGTGIAGEYVPLLSDVAAAASRKRERGGDDLPAEVE